MSQETVRSLVPTYTNRIRLHSGKALGLAILLAKAAPPDLSPSQRKKLNALEAEGRKVQEARALRSRVAGTSIQPIRGQFAAGWSALDLALESVSQLPPMASGDGRRAAEMRARLFPSGREFTKLSALEAWTHAQGIFRQIEEEQLGEELSDLIGPRFVKAAKIVTNDLGDALGLGETPRKIPSATAVADAMDSYGTTLVAYTRSLAADLDEKNEASCRRFFEAVAPIDVHRSLNTNGSEEDEENDVTPEPTPVVTGT